MSRRETVMVTCDLHPTYLDETESVVTHTFSVDGQVTEIDLCATCLQYLRSFLREFVVAGRKPQPARQAAAPSRPAASRRRSAAVRAWAEGEGLLDAGSRGRIPDYVIAHYDAEHGGAR